MEDTEAVDPTHPAPLPTKGRAVDFKTVLEKNDFKPKTERAQCLPRDLENGTDFKTKTKRNENVHNAPRISADIIFGNQKSIFGDQKLTLVTNHPVLVSKNLFLVTQN